LWRFTLQRRRRSRFYEATPPRSGLRPIVRELFEGAGLFAELDNAAEPSSTLRLDNQHFIVGSVERFARQDAATGREGHSG
jgi:hypothetical protein